MWSFVSPLDLRLKVPSKVCQFWFQLLFGIRCSNDLKPEDVTHIASQLAFTEIVAEV